jgi:putative transposase
VRSEKTQVQTATAISSGTDGMQRRVPLEVFKTAFDGPDPLLRHVRTQVRSPHTNGVIQRWLSTLKYEHLFRGVVTDGDALDMEVHRFRIIYNAIRPHQALGDRTPSAADTGCDQQKPLHERQKWALRSLAVQRSLPAARAASSVAASMSVKVPVSILSINGAANRPSGPPLGT